MSSAQRFVCPRIWRGALVSMFVLAAVSYVSADGPVPPGGLAGGVQVTDSDNGNGQAWGMAGGRTITYVVTQPGNFSSLSWGVVNNTVPNLSFDGNPTSGPLQFNAGASNLASGIARWTGTATIPLAVAPGSITVPTTFTLTVTNGSGPVPLTFVAGGVSPGADVLAAGGHLTINELFTANGQPVLDYYNGLNTPAGNPPGTSGPVMTSVQTGFYYNNVATGLTHEALDADLSAKIASVKNDTAFLVIDDHNGFLGLSGQLGQISNQLLVLQNQPAVPPGLATSQDVQKAQSNLQQTLLTLFGILPCDPAQAGPLCTTATFINQLATKAGVAALQDAINTLQGSIGALPAVQSGVQSANDQLSIVQGKLDALGSAVGGGGGKIDVSAVEVADLSNGRRRRWLINTSIQGTPVVAELTGLIAIDSRAHSPALVTDLTSLTTVTPIQPGLAELSLRAGPGGLSTADGFQISVRFINGATTAHGTLLVVSSSAQK
jgi:hypothetical protein